MLQGTRALAALAALLALVSSCSGASPPDEAASAAASASSIPNQTAWAAGTHWSYETSFGGLTAWVYRPSGFSRKAPEKRGLVFHLIGCGQRPFQVAQAGGWPDAAEAEGMVVVIPEIVAPAHPNLSAPNLACYDFGSLTEPTRHWPDHDAIITAAQRIPAAEPSLAIDPRQVYITGISAGATVAMQIGCMAPDLFAGVGSVAGDALGANQSTAVMPPGMTTDDIRSDCESYASASPARSASDDLKRQVYAIVSDDNSLPVGFPILDSQGHWTGSDFADPAYWDGDKFVDHDHHRLIAKAMAGIFDASPVDRAAPLPFTGTGSGCPGGGESAGHDHPKRCALTDAVSRPWRATLDSWKDAQGRVRVAYVQQDTLRHRWPAGPAGALDKPLTPSMADLAQQRYFDGDGFPIESKVDSAPNGKLGVFFVANDSFNYPTYFLGLMAENNPRL
jgi:poly(hydroxyalkanoate) depolymerase family esterase